MLLTDYARRVRYLLMCELFGEDFRLDKLPHSLGGEIGKLVEFEFKDEITAREKIAYIKGLKAALDIVDKATMEEEL